MASEAGRGAGNKFAQRREATRRELLRLGLERFPVKGYSSTTIDDVVRDSGLTRGAFYFHFAGKEAFFLELLRERATLRDEWWLIARDPAHTDAGAAIASALAHLTSLEDGGAWPLLVADYFQAVHGAEEHLAPLRELYRRWTVELGLFVQELRLRGFARTDVAPESLGAQLFAIVEGHTVHHLLYGMPADGLLDVLVRVVRP